MHNVHSFVRAASIEPTDHPTLFYQIVDLYGNLVARTWDEDSASMYLTLGKLIRGLIGLGQLNLPVRTGRVRAEKILKLRQKVMRPGRPIGSAQMLQDEDPGCIHIATYAFDERHNMTFGSPIGCASFIPSHWGGRDAYLLRFMAVDASYHGCGIGKGLLFDAERMLAGASNIHTLWCKARSSAIPFYLKQGWQLASDVFDVTTVGPHQKMFKRF